MKAANCFFTAVRVFFVALFAGFCAISGAQADDRDDFFRAVEMNRPDQVADLLKKGVDPNIAEPYKGNTGLIIAIHEGAMETFDLLVSTPGIDLDKQSKNGNTAIMLAAWKSNVPAVRTLLKKGARVNQPGWTALHYAASVGNEEIVALLLAKKAVVDALAPNKTTPLMMAARSGHIYTVKLLLDHGADVRLRNEWGMNAIDFARDGDFSRLEEGLQSRLNKIEALASKRR